MHFDMLVGTSVSHLSHIFLDLTLNTLIKSLQSICSHVIQRFCHNERLNFKALRCL